MQWNKVISMALLAMVCGNARAEGTPPAPIAGTSTQGSGGFNPNVFNPAIGVVLDAVASHTRLNRGDFDFRSAELNLAAAVDPFANLYAVINGDKDKVSVEEAFFMTTSLPANLTLRGGRMNRRLS